MGIFINKGNEGFKRALNGEYVDKTGMIDINPAKVAEYMNSDSAGELLLVGIKYDKEAKQHTCVIENMP